jgi:eukaryotic-like serine/threonine-protein kinase
VHLGKYQLVAEIARGGMGIVYLGVVRGPGRFTKLFVLKALKPELAEDASFVEMFLEEARLAARLSHPNIVQTYEVARDGQHYFLVMDYLEGVTLGRLLHRRLPGFTLPMQLRVLCEVLSGLDHAHALTDYDGTPLGMVHRDATPQNVFITYDGHVKLVDFGIAKAIDSAIETRTGMFKGKPGYMAPEQLTGEADPRTDLYTVGVMLWEAIAGRRMWHKRKDVDVLTAVARGHLPSLVEVAPHAPPELVAICERTLARDPARRPASALQLRAEIERWLRTSGNDVSLREVATVVGEGFAADRATVRAAIEGHLAALATGEVVAETQLLKLPSLRGPSASEGTPVSSVASASTPMRSVPPRVQAAVSLPLPVPEAASVRRPSWTTRVLYGAGGAAGVGLALVLALAFRSPAPGPSASPTPLPATPSIGSGSPSVGSVAGASASPVVEASPMAASTHEVAVKVVPAKAVVTIDGTEVSNPVTKHCIHGRAFAVHASLPGFVSTDRTLECDHNASVEIALTSAPPGTPPPAAPLVHAGPVRHPATPVAPPPSSEVTPTPATLPTERRPGEVSPTGGTRPRRPIETSSPYGSK